MLPPRCSYEVDYKCRLPGTEMVDGSPYCVGHAVLDDVIRYALSVSEGSIQCTTNESIEVLGREDDKPIC
jgi:hypothetical protein